MYEAVGLGWLARLSRLPGISALTEAAYALKLLVESLGGKVECRTDGAALPAGNRSGYVGTASIADIIRCKRASDRVQDRADIPLLEALQQRLTES